jgi:hypothetical protein
MFLAFGEGGEDGQGGEEGGELETEYHFIIKSRLACFGRFSIFGLYLGRNI